MVPMQSCLMHLSQDFRQLIRLNSVWLYMQRHKRQNAKQSLPELGESIRRLEHFTYPTAPGEVTGMIAKNQIVDALTDFDMRPRI